MLSIHKSPSREFGNSEFGPHVENIARHYGFTTVGHITEIDISDFKDKEGLVLDADGTLYPYGVETGPDDEVVEWIHDAYQYLEGKLIVVSNNKAVRPFDSLPIPISSRKSWYDYKITRFRNRNAINSLAIPLDKIIAITDSPSDILSNRLAGIEYENQYLARSLGAHPVQEFAHDYAYPRIAHLGSLILQMQR